MKALREKELLALCRKICVESHEGQFRNDGIEAYSSHPLRVADSLGNVSLKCIALLHDVIEDTEETEASLREKGVSEFILDGVDLMTKKKGQSYENYIYTISLHSHIAKIKIADMVDNLCSSPSEKQKAKYRKAVSLLIPEIGKLDY